MKQLTCFTTHLTLALVISLIASVTQAKTLMVEIAFNHGIHQINKVWTVERTYPATVSDETSQGDIVFSLSDGNGKVLYHGNLPKPGLLVKEPVVAAEHELALTGNEYQPQGIYTLRLPFDEQYLTLELAQIQDSEMQPSNRSGAKETRSSHLGVFQLQNQLNH